MKRILLFLTFCFLFISCSKNDNKNDNGYLKNLESVNSGIAGTWKTTTGGVWYAIYKKDGISCGGLYSDKDWDSCSKYEIVKSNSDFFIRQYHVGSDVNYSTWKIIILNQEKLEVKEVNGDRHITYTRVN